MLKNSLLAVAMLLSGCGTAEAPAEWHKPVHYEPAPVFQEQKLNDSFYRMERTDGRVTVIEYRNGKEVARFSLIWFLRFIVRLLV